MKKLFSKKGQVSMELGILVFSTVIVAGLTSITYIKNEVKGFSDVSKYSNATSSKFGDVGVEVSKKLANESLC